MKYLHQFGFSALLLNACAGNTASDRNGIAIDTIAIVDTIVTSDAALGGQIELAVAPAGRVYIADARMQRLISVAEDGSDLHFIGRKGNGPGEFHTPWLIGVTGDSLRVWEANRRTI